IASKPRRIAAFRRNALGAPVIENSDHPETERGGLLKIADDAIGERRRARNRHSTRVPPALSRSPQNKPHRQARAKQKRRRRKEPSERHQPRIVTRTFREEGENDERAAGDAPCNENAPELVVQRLQ